MTSIYWFRRDLRLTDNHGLITALKAGPVIPVFILDPVLLSRSAPQRHAFLFDGLHALDADLRKRGSSLILRKGKPLEILKEFLHEARADSLFAEEDYTPFARKRDQAIAKELPLQLVPGQTVHHPNDIKKSDGTPYKVYTPFSRNWKALFPPFFIILPAPEFIPTPTGLPSEPIPTAPSNHLFPAGEAEAIKRLTLFIKRPIFQYSDQRNRIDLEGTSTLSPYLHFGMVGLRQAAYEAFHAIQFAQGIDSKKSAETWLNELIWREFYIYILYHFPYAAKRTFNPALQNITWLNNESEFQAWKDGLTGIPVVDAAMRQLMIIGWMHNRVRMIVASFLVKDLLINWQWGEELFMKNLLDGDLAANNGGWQWVAGTGTDAAPYFRIFNPILQSVKFDPNGDYIRNWVPELAHLSKGEIHAPWRKGIIIKGYPKTPIVIHEAVRERTLYAYRLAKESKSVLG